MSLKGRVFGAVAFAATGMATFGQPVSAELYDRLRQALGPRPGFAVSDPERVKLGQLLFYDPILSGNRNISCATCHHPKFGTSDGVSLSIGEGGIGLGPDRHIGASNIPEQRVPRNSPGLWNLGAGEFTAFFHDGRLETDLSQPHGIRTPLGSEMTRGFASALAAQAMFPVLSPDEMAGHYSENDVSRAVRMGLITGADGAWDMIAGRVASVPEYAAAFDTIAPGRTIAFTDIANVIADFIAFEWRADNSAFDIALTGGAKLPRDAARGMALFYGGAGCSDCHSGWLQTDHRYHAIAVPQFGPGKAARFETHSRDEGRKRVTGESDDIFRFRTPSLRNVTLTPPYGHTGAYATLEDMIRHHLAPVQSLQSYRVGSAILPELPGATDSDVMTSPSDLSAIAAANELRLPALSDAQISDLIAFLHALEAQNERLGTPARVPSGLALEE